MLENGSFHTFNNETLESLEILDSKSKKKDDSEFLLNQTQQNQALKKANETKKRKSGSPVEEQKLKRVKRITSSTSQRNEISVKVVVKKK